jgi:hypothetical protein
LHGVLDRAGLIAPLVSANQFHEIAERWEEFKKRKLAEEAQKHG